MNPKLRNLLFFAGALSAGVGVYLIRDTVPGTNRPVTPAVLVDAGIRADCTPRFLRCELRDEDSPHPTDGGSRYHARRIPYARCPEGDGGVSILLNLKPRVARFLYNRGTCRDVGAATWPDVRDVDFADTQVDTFDCRCKRRGGACTQLDGGAIPLDTAYDSSKVTGAGCVPTPCNVVAGEYYMNPVCK